MIMKIFSLENDITFTEEYINVLQIQDKKLFTNVINSLNDNINNIEDTKERIIILDNDIEIKIEKEVLMIIDVFNIDFNQKKIQSALYNKIEKIDVVEYLLVAKLLIFVNLKLYLSDDELNEIYKYAMYKKVNILLIETGEEKEPIKNEKILFVDSDYDEIILYNK